MRHRVVVIGGGAFLPKLCELLAGAPAMPALEVRAVARDAARLRTIVAFAAEQVARHREDWHVAAHDDLGTALDGAAVVVPLLRVGGFRARRHDETFPARLGRVGDEGLGLGGFANAWRTLPVMDDVATAIRRACPDAWVLNLVAPLEITTRHLLDRGLRAVGLCELPVVTRRRLQSGPGPSSAAELAYAGLNHLGWHWPLGPSARADLEAACARGEDDAEVLDRFGALPLPYFYDVVEPAVGRRLGRRGRAGRADVLEQLSSDLVEHFARRDERAAVGLAQRATPWFDDALLPAIRALLTDLPAELTVNVRNAGLVRELDPEQVVEVPASIDASGWRPRAAPPLPAAVAAFLADVDRASSLAHHASVHRERRLMADAIGALPPQMAPHDVEGALRAVCQPLERPQEVMA